MLLAREQETLLDQICQVASIISQFKIQILQIQMLIQASSIMLVLMRRKILKFILEIENKKTNDRLN